MFDFLVSLVVILLFSTVMTINAYAILSQMFGVDGISIRLRFVFSYFLGIPIVLSLWRFLCLLVGAEISFILIFTLGFLFSCRFAGAETKKQSWDLRSFSKKTLYFFLFYILVQVALILFWAQSGLENAYSTMGSGHSPRYSNIAIYLFKFDTVPVLGQNFAQSMLAAIPLYFKFLSPLIALNIWLAFSISALIVLIYELIHLHGLSRFQSVCGSLIVFLGSTSSSFSQTMVIDSGSPFFFNGYTDSIISIGSFYATLQMIWSWNQKSCSKYNKSFYIFLLLIFLSWTMLGVQNFYLLGVILFFSLFVNRVYLRISKTRFYLITGLLLISVLIGRFSGGMLTDKRLFTEVPFGGMQTMSGPGQFIQLNFGVPSVVGSYRDWQPGIPADASFGQRLQKSLETIFWPVIGFLLCSYLVFKRKLFEEIWKKQLYFESSICFFAGLLIVAPISILGSKWELTRFLMIGYMSGLFYLSISICYFFNKARRNSILLLIAAAVCFGPISSIRQRYDMNFYEGMGLKFKLDSMFNLREFVK